MSNQIRVCKDITCCLYSFVRVYYVHWLLVSSKDFRSFCLLLLAFRKFPNCSKENDILHCCKLVTHIYACRRGLPRNFPDFHSGLFFEIATLAFFKLYKSFIRSLRCPRHKLALVNIPIVDSGSLERDVLHHLHANRRRCNSELLQIVSTTPGLLPQY